MDSRWEAELEADFKRHPSDRALARLASCLIYSNPTSSSSHRRGVQLLHRAVEQYNSPDGLKKLARYYEMFGNPEQKKEIIPLLETVLRTKPSAVNHFDFGYTLFYGDFGRGKKYRGLFLMQRAISMETDPPPFWVSDLARAWLSFDGSTRAKKRVAALCEGVAHLEDSLYVMEDLVHIFETGTEVMPPCNKCASKWRRRAAAVRSRVVMSESTA